MLRSMTGYGAGNLNTDLASIKIEIKGYNNRYADIQIKLPKYLNFIEENIRNRILEEVTRGKIDVYVNINLTGKRDIGFDIDRPLYDAYVETLKNLEKYAPFEFGKYSIIDILKMDENILNLKKEDFSENESFKKDILSCLDAAISNFVEMKTNEGYNIQNDLKKKILFSEEILQKIELHAKDAAVLNYNNLKERIFKILEEENVEPDNDRLINELVIYTDKFSIDEEIVRLKSHIKAFYEILSGDSPVGKKLDFLIQEMNRETNTIGSKSNLIEITNLVVELKSVIEKMREQVQNIE